MYFDFDVLLRQMLSFYTIILVGFLGYKTKFFRDSEVSALSYLTIRIFLPTMLLTSIVNTAEMDKLRELPSFLLYLVLAFFIMLAIGYISGRFLRLKNPTLGVHSSVVALPNDGYLGYPLWLAVFPDRAGLAIVAACMLYALAQWTIAYPLVTPRGTGVKFQWKRIITIPLVAAYIGIALMLVGFKPVGNPIWDTLTGIGSCTKYTAMIYIGATLAQKGFKRIFGRPALFAMAPIKLLLGPLVVYVLLGLLGILDANYLAMVVMISAMPSPMVICIQAAMTGSDEEYAVGSMVLSTLCCLVTVPIVMHLITLF